MAEEPEAHLLPRIREWCERDTRLQLADVRTDPSGAYVLSLAWKGTRGDLRGVRAAAYSLIGEIAESATYIRQRLDGMPSTHGERLAQGAGVRFEVGTGMLAGDTPFTPHGHVLIVEVADAQ